MMMRSSDLNLVEMVRSKARRISAASEDYDHLLDVVGDASLVLIGEASHGTHEFYRRRAEITKKLIAEKGFNAVAVEADWPDAYRVNRFVRGVSDDADAEEALSDFRRFPSWMWRNTDVVEFADWLHAHNMQLPQGRRKIGFYGLDLYSLSASIEAVLGYLDKVDPEAAKRARIRYGCFEKFHNEGEAYAYATNWGAAEACEDDVVRQLMELQRKAAEYATRDGRVAEDEYFYAEQNARLVLNAEEYYRSMFRGSVASWNLRDQHMAETLGALVEHLGRYGEPTKVVVWEHNSHLGDARATEMGDGGELNVGQLVRERHGDQARLFGFTTYAGTVTAASDWGGVAERKRVRPALPGSYEYLLHAVGIPRFTLNLQEGGEMTERLRHPRRLERAIGVIYSPETERMSHYFYASLPDQFDAIIHLDETRALEPLEVSSEWEAGEPPETYPFAA